MHTEGDMLACRGDIPWQQDPEMLHICERPSIVVEMHVVDQQRGQMHQVTCQHGRKPVMHRVRFVTMKIGEFHSNQSDQHAKP